MDNNPDKFIMLHPETKGMMYMYITAWIEEFGEDIHVDVSASQEEANNRVRLYKSKGWTLKDENIFGRGTDVLGVIQCYKKEVEVEKQKNISR